ncbi:MAG: glycosyltransferase family 2 protein [Patescibacteria group bacterium]
MKIFVVVPAWNEESRLGNSLDQLKNQYQNVVVVDDGSVDNTTQVAAGRGLVVLNHLINRGQGAALQTGDEYALKNGADIIIHFDADGQHQVAEIARLIEPIVEGRADIVFGSRFLGNSRVPWTKKWLILKPAILFNWLFTGVKLSDAHNGLRALSAKAARLINITHDEMAHASEILAQVRKNRLRYQEVPVDIIYHRYGQGFGAGWKILKDLILKKILK